jgi:NADPH-dependent glutamate synthase beta subunit-like oxidoreductase/2,4-dienoyl-CoA reductase-like NADH-dependent reductase (Old Yellow Enzyme family)
MSDIKKHEMFNFYSLQDVKNKVKELNLNINFEDNIKILVTPFELNGIKLRNRFVILPMEGCDASSIDGSPLELTYRRYKRFATGGAAILWYEACAVVPEGRANPRQLWINEKSLDNIKRLCEETDKAARTYDSKHKTIQILQLTHSGRYSKPDGFAKPIIAHHSKILDPIHNIGADYPLITDDELKRLEDEYVKAAILAEKAGFDGVDLKSCHRYLLSELLASHTRENSVYGGSFENRSRFLKNTITKIKEAVNKIFVTTRINAYDCIEYPYGFGVDKDNYLKPDLTEIKEILKFLKSKGAPIVNISIGNPYFNPHIGRPYDLPIVGFKPPAEHPLLAIQRFFDVVKELQVNNPEISVVGAGYTWLRNYFPQVAASNIKNGYANLIGLGRMGFAYPDCIKDLTEKGSIDSQKVCVACSACTQIMRDGGKAGCVPRDAEAYSEIYKKGRLESQDNLIKMAQWCMTCVDPTCRNYCPTNIDIPGFISKIAQNDFKQAYEIITQNNPFPEVCGNICPSEVLCQSGCIRQYYDEPVKIRDMQRIVSERARINNWLSPLPSITKNKKVAILGAGPSGIACAKKLIDKGYEITLIDKNEQCGGVPLDLIPTERIANESITGEIKFRFAENKSPNFKGGINISKDYDLNKIKNEGYDAIYIALGLTEYTKLPVETKTTSGVEDAFMFLKRIKRGTNSFVPNTVAILGAGNTAIDAAITAKNFGAKDVYIVYRRSFNEMPAWQKEKEHALKSGINFLILSQPVDYITDNNGKLTGLKVFATRLSQDADQSGRRTAIVIPNSEHILEVDLVVEALGQKISKETKEALNGIEFTKSGLIKVKGNSQATSVNGVFAGGDIINGGDTVVRAIGDGVKAANEIEEFLSSR